MPDLSTHPAVVFSGPERQSIRTVAVKFESIFGFLPMSVEIEKKMEEKPTFRFILPFTSYPVFYSVPKTSDEWADLSAAMEWDKSTRLTRVTKFLAAGTERSRNEAAARVSRIVTVEFGCRLSTVEVSRDGMHLDFAINGLERAFSFQADEPFIFDPDIIRAFIKKELIRTMPNDSSITAVQSASDREAIENAFCIFASVFGDAPTSVTIFPVETTKKRSVRQLLFRSPRFGPPPHDEWQCELPGLHVTWTDVRTSLTKTREALKETPMPHTETSVKDHLEASDQLKRQIEKADELVKRLAKELESARRTLQLINDFVPPKLTRNTHHLSRYPNGEEMTGTALISRQCEAISKVLGDKL